MLLPCAKFLSFALATHRFVDWFVKSCRFELFTDTGLHLRKVLLMSSMPSSNSTVLFNWLTSSCCCHLPSFFRLRFQHTRSWIHLSRAAGLNSSLTLASISEKFCWCQWCRQAIQLFFVTDWLHHVVTICQFCFVCTFNTHVRSLDSESITMILDGISSISFWRRLKLVVHKFLHGLTASSSGSFIFNEFNGPFQPELSERVLTEAAVVFSLACARGWTCGAFVTDSGWLGMSVGLRNSFFQTLLGCAFRNLGGKLVYPCT